MPESSLSMLELAQRLVAAGHSGLDPAAEAGVAIERLRGSLTRLAGVEGFASLQRRALALAVKKHPSLQRVHVDALGRLQGLEQLAARAGGDQQAQATIAIIGRLLELLVTFIGEPITLRLLREAWPDAFPADHVSPESPEPPEPRKSHEDQEEDER